MHCVLVECKVPDRGSIASLLNTKLRKGKHLRLWGNMITHCCRQSKTLVTCYGNVQLMVMFKMVSPAIWRGHIIFNTSLAAPSRVCVYICLISVYLCTVDKCIQLFVIYVSTFSFHLYSFCRREEEAYKKLLNQEVVAITARDDSPRVNQYFLTFLLLLPLY